MKNNANAYSSCTSSACVEEHARSEYVCRADARRSLSGKQVIAGQGSDDAGKWRKWRLILFDKPCRKPRLYGKVQRGDIRYMNARRDGRVVSNTQEVRHDGSGVASDTTRGRMDAGAAGPV